MNTVITGANRGIGAGLLAHYGDTATGTSRRGADGLVALDVTDPGSVAGLPGRLGGQPIDLLICNAGVYPDKGMGLVDLTPQIWAEGLAANVTGVFLTVQALLPQVIAARGKIAIISSVMASDELAPGGSYVYRASKAAVLNLGRNLAADLKPRGVAVGIYHPGWVRTDMGGSAASISVNQAVTGLSARFADLSLANTGAFLSYDGKPIPF